MVKKIKFTESPLSLPSTKLLFCEIPAQGVGFDSCTPSAQFEFHEYFITNISEDHFVPV